MVIVTVVYIILLTTYLIPLITYVGWSNTLLVFVSDNGGPTNGDEVTSSNNYPLRGTIYRYVCFVIKYILYNVNIYRWKRDTVGRWD